MIGVYDAIGRKTCLVIRRTTIKLPGCGITEDIELHGVFRIQEELRLEDRLNPVEFVVPLKEMPNQEMFRFNFSCGDNKNPKNPYLMIRANVDPEKLYFMGFYGDYCKFDSGMEIQDWSRVCGLMTDGHSLYRKYLDLLKEAGFDYA